MRHTSAQAIRNGLLEGETFLGTFMKTGDPAFVESAARGGMDFVILDMEHGPASYETVGNLIRAAEASGVVPIVRTADRSESAISHVLDLGAAGVQVPQIGTEEDARDVVRAARFFPDGERGVCRFVRAADYSAVSGPEYFRKANEALIIIHLEGREAIQNLDTILEVDGIDVLFIGPYDLSQSLGLPGQVDAPGVVDAMRSIVERARARNRVVGTFTDTFEQARVWRAAGVQYLSYSVDVGLFVDACRRVRGRVL
jgi:4-hydroxy-2-oxoheptanedioate aldolase